MTLIFSEWNQGFADITFLIPGQITREEEKEDLRFALASGLLHVCQCYSTEETCQPMQICSAGSPIKLTQCQSKGLSD